MVVNQNHWSWNLLFCLFFVCVFSMVLVTNWFWNLGFLVFWFVRWFWLPIGSKILVFLFCCFLYGFGYPLVLKSWFCLFVYVLFYGFGCPLILESWFSWFYLRLLVTHWSFLVNMRMLKVLFRHSETTHKLENMYIAQAERLFWKVVFPHQKKKTTT